MSETVLSGVRIENFKKISVIDFEVKELNILVGANGSGKSSVLQAIHLAACLSRQSDRVRTDTTSTVSVPELDYLPTNDYASLGHDARWGNKEGTPSSKALFRFTHIPVGGMPAPVSAEIEFRAARNAGISVKGSIDPSLVSTMRVKKNFFSAYVPGISGIPNQESKQTRRHVLRACSFGDSNVFLRNVLDLLRESTGGLATLSAWLSELIGPVEILVSHDPNTDLVIDAKVRTGGSTFSIELLGTGYLQLIQIFSYILLYSPQVLLIDEPDTHLHPNVQQKLPALLFRVARERGTKVILTTHSPFIVRGSPLASNVLWLDGGEVKNANRSAIELALGWGAFGKRILLVSEDKDVSLLQKLLSHWPDLEAFVHVLPGRGYKKLLDADEAAELKASLGNLFKIVIHRDRDSLTDAEVNSVEASYAAQGCHVWFPLESDVEAYFCGPDIVSAVSGIDLVGATSLVDSVLVSQSVPISEQFAAQRSAHNQEFHRAGGGPTNADVLASFAHRPLRGAKGKFVFGQICSRVNGSRFTKQTVLASALPNGVAPDLRNKLLWVDQQP